MFVLGIPSYLWWPQSLQCCMYCYIMLHWTMLWQHTTVCGINHYNDYGRTLSHTLNSQNTSRIDGLVQDCSNSSASALELLQSCTKPLTYHPHRWHVNHFVSILDNNIPVVIRTTPYISYWNKNCLNEWINDEWNMFSPTILKENDRKQCDSSCITCLGAQL